MNIYDKIAIQLKTGSEEAFTELYHLIEKNLINHLLKMLASQEKAEEIFHETFIQIIKKVDSSKPISTLENSFRSLFLISLMELCLFLIKREIISF